MPRLNKYDRSHLAHLSTYQRQVDAIYAEAAKEAARLAAQISDFNASVAFSFADYPMTRKRCDALLERLKNNLYGVIANGVRSEWTLANNKNDELSRQVFGANVGRLSQAQYRRYFSTNGAARDAFIARRDAGMNLSDRVWNYTSQFKAEMEQVCDIGIRNGMSAEEMQRDLQQYLNHPDNFFRRFRYKEGVDESGKPLYGRKWKKRFWDEVTGGYRWEDVDLNDYRYGRGVYRSSYKNARRLAVTETNIAYRTADHLRWQQMDFVVGIHIEPSNTNHPVIDICDTLAGDYPKDFKWTGWHPHCRCYATSILKTEEEMSADNARILAGEDVKEGGENQVTELPDNFKQWVERNQERIARAKSKPYFLRDNEALIDASTAPVVPVQPQVPRKTAAEIATERHSARTLADQRRIQDAWDARKYGQEYVDGIHELEKSLGVERGLRMSFDEADKQNANPNYGKGKEYGVNCQTCAPAFALRLAGFDVTAKGNTAGSLMNALSRQQSLYAWNNPDGSVAPYTNLYTWMMNKGYKAMSESRYLEFWNESTTETGVYIFTINWKGGGAHISVLMRLADGTLRYVEPQHDNSSNPVDKELLGLAKAGSTKPKGVRGIIRVDDKIFNSKWAGIFNVRKRRK